MICASPHRRTQSSLSPSTDNPDAEVPRQVPPDGRHLLQRHRDRQRLHLEGIDPELDLLGAERAPVDREVHENGYIRDPAIVTGPIGLMLLTVIEGRSVTSMSKEDGTPTAGTSGQRGGADHRIGHGTRQQPRTKRSRCASRRILSGGALLGIPRRPSHGRAARRGRSWPDAGGECRRKCAASACRAGTRGAASSRTRSP